VLPIPVNRAILEKMGTCTIKHAVIATLAAELDLPVEKNIGIDAMTEKIVTGAGRILEKFGLFFFMYVSSTGNSERVLAATSFFLKINPNVAKAGGSQIIMQR
jgi:hypothetical protein